RSVAAPAAATSSPWYPAATSISPDSPSWSAPVTHEPIFASAARTHRPHRGARRRSLVVVAHGRARDLPSSRLRAVALDRAQPGPDAVADLAREARAGRLRRPVPEAVRRRDRRARRRARGAEHVVVAARAADYGPVDRLLLRGIRAAPVAADLRRRPWRARRRSLQGGERPRRPADWRRLHVPAGLLSPAHLGRRLAGRELRAAELGGRADRDRADAGREAVRHGGAARRAVGARRRLAGANGAREAL